MPYKFATENIDFSDLSAGRVLYGTPGHPALSVRLVSETFQRCAALLSKQGHDSQYVIYDPCCGGAYHLTTLSYLHWPCISTIFASDIDVQVLKTAEKNLSLLTPAGLEKRTKEISHLFQEFRKSSHQDALMSAHSLNQQLRALQEGSHVISSKTFVADGTNLDSIKTGLDGVAPDIVITDVPYGQKSAWQSDSSEAGGLKRSLVAPLLATLQQIASSHTIVAIIANKGQKFPHESFKRLDRFQIGKRKITLLQPIN